MTNFNENVDNYKIHCSDVNFINFFINSIMSFDNFDNLIENISFEFYSTNVINNFNISVDNDIKEYISALLEISNNIFENHYIATKKIMIVDCNKILEISLNPKKEKVEILAYKSDKVVSYNIKTLKYRLKKCSTTDEDFVSFVLNNHIKDDIINDIMKQVSENIISEHIIDNIKILIMKIKTHKNINLFL